MIEIIVNLIITCLDGRWSNEVLLPYTYSSSKNVVLIKGKRFYYNQQDNFIDMRDECVFTICPYPDGRVSVGQYLWTAEILFYNVNCPEFPDNLVDYLVTELKNDYLKEQANYLELKAKHNVSNGL